MSKHLSQISIQGIENGYKKNKAMDYAITRTKAAGYLVDYLNKIEAEAKAMLLTEFNEKAYEEVVREEGRAEGRAEGEAIRVELEAKVSELEAEIRELKAKNTTP